MYWRIDKGEKWDDVKGAPAKRRLKKMIRSGEARGVLAYAGKEPVGWCTFGPRPHFKRLDRARTLACDDAHLVWAVPCFFIRKDCRRKGVATAMLGKALEVMRKRGAAVAEGYPVNPHGAGGMPDVFAWTGTLSLFEKLDFTIAGDRKRSKVRVRRDLDR